MKRRVLHFVRKNTQLKASFINNQISRHLDYEPLIVFRNNVLKLNDGGFADFDLSSFDYLDLSKNETFFEKIRFKTIKTLSGRQMLLIEKLINDKEIDICHFHYGTDCGVFYSLQNRLKIPSVVSFYGYDAFSFHKRVWGYGQKYLCERVFSKVDCILAMSPEMKKDLIKIGCPEEKLVIHYHGVPSKVFGGIKKSYDQERNRFTLLIISSLVPVKGHIFIFKALKQLIAQGFDKIKLRIGGHGFFEPKLREYVHENQLDKYVSFLGPLNYGSAEMFTEYKNADVFIHPSVLTKDDKEGIPGAIVEAMLAGLPIIATYHGGIPYIIKNGETGLLIKEWDVNGLAIAIRKLIIDRKLCEQIGKAGQEYALHHLDIVQKEIELEEIYNKLIDNWR